MKSLKKELSLDTAFDVAKELPFLGVEDADVIDSIEPCNGVKLWLCEDDCGNRSIVRNDICGTTAIGMCSSREDQLTLAAWAVDFDLSIISSWISDEDIEIILKDARENGWIR